MFVFPIHLFNPQSVEAILVRRVVAGGASITNEEDAIATDGGGVWQITLAGIELDSTTRRELEAWDAYLAGGAVECLVPLLSLVTANTPNNHDGPLTPSDLAYDDRLFPTYVRTAAAHIVATTGAAAMRATSLAITVTKGAQLKGGERFSIGERAYRIINYSGGIATIDPPLREAVADGTAVEFEWPVVKCRLAIGQNVLPPTEFDGAGSTSLTFVECR